LNPAEQLRESIEDFLNTAGNADDPQQLEELRRELSEKLAKEISEREFNLLRRTTSKTMIREELLPWIEHRLREGVISNAGILANYTSGVIIRDSNGQTIALRSEIVDITELRADLQLLLQRLTADKQFAGLVYSLLNLHLAPTLIPDLKATAGNVDDAVKMLRPIMRQIMAGEIIVHQGEKVKAEQLPILRTLWSTEYVKFHVVRFLGILLAALILCVGLFFSPSGSKMAKIESKDLLFIGFIVAFFTVLAKAFALLGAATAASTGSFAAGAQVFAVPVAGATLMITSFSSRRYFIASMLLAMFCTLIGQGAMPLFLFYFLSALFGSWITNQAQSRKEIVRTLPKLLCALVPLWLAATMAQGGAMDRIYSEFAALMLGGFLSLLLTFALPPLIEILFGFTTRFSLMDLVNQEHPVLRQLMFDAPGTYHHSLIVANMAELAAKAIKADSLLCKVGAMYHDIGKIDKPLYFIENQFRGENPHDKISPAMSALVLISHVKYGVELAEQAHLGREITDIIREHHGNGVIRYFYQKALAANSQVRIEDFCYSGPRPSTIESAIIMLADVVEASSRTLDNPTPSRLRTHVQRMIRAVLGEGQLNNVDLTFKDLEQVEGSFTLILTGMFHKRIEYPGKQNAKPAVDNAAAPALEAAEGKAQGGALPAADSRPVENLAPGLPAQPTAFDRCAEKQTQKEQEDLRPDDYHAAKWLDLEDSFNEMTLMYKNYTPPEAGLTPGSGDSVNPRQGDSDAGNPDPDKLKPGEPDGAGITDIRIKK
jgi:putative nucleotidyltransferase with HDIG domain